MSAKLQDDPELSRAQKAQRSAEEILRPRLKKQGLSLGNEIFIRIFKETRELEVFLKDAQTATFRLLKSYKICTYSGELGPKLKEGDLQAPEGFYSVGRAAMNPLSNFHLAFDLGYPNAYDRAQGRSGSYLMVHGNCISTGCYAMTDRRIEEIYTLADAALAGGQKRFHIHCFPFRMTRERMAEALRSGSPWLSFWESLKRGYDLFEAERVPPLVGVEGLDYTFRNGKA
jgi:murein L,D-transpeptidase YafK